MTDLEYDPSDEDGDMIVFVPAHSPREEQHLATSPAINRLKGGNDE